MLPSNHLPLLSCLHEKKGLIKFLKEWYMGDDQYLFQNTVKILQIHYRFQIRFDFDRSSLFRGSAGYIYIPSGVREGQGATLLLKQTHHIKLLNTKPKFLSIYISCNQGKIKIQIHLYIYIYYLVLHMTFWVGHIFQSQ